MSTILKAFVASCAMSLLSACAQQGGASEPVPAQPVAADPVLQKY